MSSCLVSAGVAAASEGVAARYLGLEAEAGVGVGVDPWLTLVVIRMARRCRRRLSWTAKGPVADSKLKIGLIGGAVAMVEAVGELAVAVTMVVDVQQEDSEVVDAVGGMARAEPAGGDAIRVALLLTSTRSALALVCVHRFLTFQYVLQLLL
jgi:hypothetical protein